jgi:ribosome modulation factor
LEDICPYLQIGQRVLYMHSWKTHEVGDLSQG